MYQTRTLHIGTLTLGGDAPVRIQSMTNTDTMDTFATVEQCKRLADEGCEIVRITAQGVKEAENLANIKSSLIQQGYTIPLVADIHFQPKAAEIAAAIVEKIRINPGNYIPVGAKKFSPLQIIEKISPLLDICKTHKTVIRVGVNHGSLSERITMKFGNTPQGMVESAMEFVRIIHDLNFDNLVLSMKASHVKTMVDATRLLVSRLQAEGFDYPIHLGVTEAGDGEDGRIKSAIGIGSLLLDGIGNTIRISLTEKPENEISVAKAILQSCGNRVFTAEYIACPSCGRTQYDIESVLQEVKRRTKHLKGLKIAVMGCIVNGPGEMADADYGYVGAGPGKVVIYKGKKIVRKDVDAEVAVDALMDVITNDPSPKSIE
ncbi:MAG: (E)-4-hydroxy-3-methylbut-2-enyl-diphosphate synthase [Bacteroidales bacterium]|jgi:(E)-4-hydroxy-3-methylbut-2-enyl-diphosphate synthase|nr:(E)-4-hydroxy-3-methylbut-2-enyl-diphosphate synthase [Bacteroidales bacterium]